MPSNFNVVIIIQARMGSSRLPGKVMKDISNRPMLWHVINRLKYSRLKKNMVVATSTFRDDDVIEKFCVNNNVNFYRGSEQDVLDRYYHAAKAYKADAVVRITSDCPLIDPQVTDKVIRGYLESMNSFDVASNLVKRTYPRGLDTEVISFLKLERIWKIAREDYQREHVMIYIHEHPEEFKILSIENSENLSHLRWTVDEEPDMLFVREVYKRLYQKKKIFSMEDVLKILEQEPHLLEINKDIKQKNIKWEF